MPWFVGSRRYFEETGVTMALIDGNHELPVTHQAELIGLRGYLVASKLVGKKCSLPPNSPTSLTLSWEVKSVGSRHVVFIKRTRDADIKAQEPAANFA